MFRELRFAITLSVLYRNLAYRMDRESYARLFYPMEYRAFQAEHDRVEI